MNKQAIEELEHTADWAIRVYGADLGELFANAARGMFGLMGLEQKAEPSVERLVELQAFDVETLLVDWLSELLYFNEEYDEVYGAFQIDAISPTQLKAIVRGGPVSGHGEHIKAVTFNELAVKHLDKGLETIIVFDV